MYEKDLNSRMRSYQLKGTAELVIKAQVVFVEREWQIAVTQSDLYGQSCFWVQTNDVAASRLIYLFVSLVLVRSLFLSDPSVVGRRTTSLLVIKL